MKKNIAILAGGNSSEFEISIKSAEQIEKVIDHEKYNSFVIMVKGTDWSYSDHGKLISVNKNDFSIEINKQIIHFQCALIAIHGTPGEDGKLQSYFELIQIPYTTCGVLSSSLTFNKYTCNTFLRGFDVLSARSVLIKKQDKYNLQEIVDNVGLPCFVKPNEGGSSCGVSKVHKVTELEQAIQKAFEDDNQVIIEQFINGMEVTCGLIKTLEKEIIFPLTEIVSKNEFFDYEAKYAPAMSEEITPARVSKDIEKKIKQLSSRIYDVLDCRGVVRIDYIVSGNQIYFLEINTVPGMSEASIVPKMANSFGMSLTDLFSVIIEDSIVRFKI